MLTTVSVKIEKAESQFEVSSIRDSASNYPRERYSLTIYLEVHPQTSGESFNVGKSAEIVKLFSIFENKNSNHGFCLG